MKVWVVYSEFNRGADLDGATEIEGVFATQELADTARHYVALSYKHELGYTVYDGEVDVEWDVDVRVREEEVQE